jgi:hypothetical protein
VRPDLEAPLRFLRTAFEPEDWIAVLLKSHATGAAIQRIRPIERIASPSFQAWLRSQNARGLSVYVGVNPIAARSRSRTRDAVAAIRNIFLDGDVDGPALLSAVASRADLPNPSIVVGTSASRVHVVWRVVGFEKTEAEGLQRQLACELGTDRAAVACTQMTRLPGFLNYKHRPATTVSAVYSLRPQIAQRCDFPAVRPSTCRLDLASPASLRASRTTDVLLRARRYLAAIPPATQGRHGDAATFRVCCRLTRGFALSDEEAMALLVRWNATCEPPWRAVDLRAKLRAARRHGREPLGGLLRRRSTPG